MHPYSMHPIPDEYALQEVPWGARGAQSARYNSQTQSESWPLSAAKTDSLAYRQAAFEKNLLDKFASVQSAFQKKWIITKRSITQAWVLMQSIKFTWQGRWKRQEDSVWQCWHSQLLHP